MLIYVWFASKSYKFEFNTFFQLFDDHCIPFCHHQKQLFPLIRHVIKAKPFQRPFIFLLFFVFYQQLV
jgi:hypothetical protein